jgi:hypothetical protein
LLQGRPYIWLLAAPVAFAALALVYPMLQMFLISIRSCDPTAIIKSRFTPGEGPSLVRYREFLNTPNFTYVFAAA